MLAGSHPPSTVETVRICVQFPSPSGIGRTVKGYSGPSLPPVRSTPYTYPPRSVGDQQVEIRGGAHDQLRALGAAVETGPVGEYAQLAAWPRPAGMADDAGLPHDLGVAESFRCDDVVVVMVRGRPAFAHSA